MPSPSVFISYSHKDEDWKDRLVTHLGVLEEAGILDLWNDRRIEAGDDWKPEIEEAESTANHHKIDVASLRRRYGTTALR